LRTITNLRLKKDRRGVSNIIVIVLSLVIITVIASNVVLWSYQMNQLDWEREKENVDILLATRFSPWYVAQKEYTVEPGKCAGGYYVYTQIDDGTAEQFIEGYKDPPGKYLLEIYNDFTIDLSSFPLSYAKSIEIQLKYSVNSTEDYWHLNAWNWITNKWLDLGWSKPTAAWTWVYFIVETLDLTNLVNAVDGRVRIEVTDRNIKDDAPTIINVDCLSVRTTFNGLCFKLKNTGSLTANLVALWVLDSSGKHTRYEINLFLSPGETTTYWADITWPSGPYLIKVMTERGNIAVYSGG